VSEGAVALLAALLLLILMPVRVDAQTAPSPATAAPTAAVKKSPAPTKDTDPKTCTTPDCHGNVKAYKVLHGPVNVDACNSCHTLKDPATHKFEDTRPKNQTCTFCHKMEIPAGMTVHAPVKTGDCLGCHNPHGGKNTTSRTTSSSAASP
jgi:hypothetical protein